MSMKSNLPEAHSNVLAALLDGLSPTLSHVAAERLSIPSAMRWSTAPDEVLGQLTRSIGWPLDGYPSRILRIAGPKIGTWRADPMKAATVQEIIEVYTRPATGSGVNATVTLRPSGVGSFRIGKMRVAVSRFYWLFTSSDVLVTINNFGASTQAEAIPAIEALMSKILPPWCGVTITL